MKSGKMTFYKHIIHIFVLVITMLMFTACATTKIMHGKDDEAELKLEKYKILYIYSPKEDEDPREVYPKVVSRLEALGFEVRILNQDETNEGAQGTGFIIDNKGHILTAEHVIGKMETATVWIKGQRYDASILETDSEKDIALLKLENLETIPVQPLYLLESPEYKMGDDVYTIGFPLSDILGTSPRFNKGMISSTVGVKDDPDSIQVSAEIQPGNSGGPLLNEDGQVIGILQATLNPMNVFARTGGNLPQNVNFAVKMDIISKFIEGSESGINLGETEKVKMSFDEVSEAVVLVRAGNITEEYLSQPKAYCKVSYISMWDMWYRFRAFQLEFFDYDSGDLILRVGKYGDGVFTTEDKVINHVFEQLRNEIPQG